MVGRSPLELMRETDLPRDFSSSCDESPPQGRTDDEANDTKRRADHRHPAGAWSTYTSTVRSAPISAASTGCRKAPVSAWKANYSGMTVYEAKRLKALEDENAKLNRLLAEQMLDMAAMKELLSKKW